MPKKTESEKGKFEEAISKQFSGLKVTQEDVKEVIKGFECGIGLENFNDLKINDTIETFRLNKIDQYL